MSTEKTGEVKRRRVFYIPGYDPIPPRRYRELYRKEGAKQAAISGYTLTLSPKSGQRFGWQVDSEIDDANLIAKLTCWSGPTSCNPAWMQAFSKPT